MTRQRWVIVAAAAAVVVAGLLVTLLVARRPSPPTNAAGTPVPGAPTAPDGVAARKIKARLFYVSDDGRRLVGMEREVLYGEGAAAQAREILIAQLEPPVEPLVSALSPAASLRAVFVTDAGEAFVDISQDPAAAPAGGSLGELLAIYTIVHALTENLPAITSVQLLVNGKEVDTLAGHVDLRGPLAKNTEWIQ